jgi:hypothetical protein
MAPRSNASASALQEPRLAGGFGQLPAERLARIVERVIDQFALLAALRR